MSLERIDMTQILTPDQPRTEQPVPLERISAVHVLVADADPETRAVREQQLLAAGHRVSVARTAFEAIVKATCHVPDMILIDPSLSDIEFADTIDFLRHCPVTADIPVARLARGRGVSQRLLGDLRRLSR